jgi:hypothetical protein
MKTLMAAMAVAVASAAGAAAAADVTGTWTMKVTGGPHGAATMGLVLKQEGASVSGTFSSGHAADMAVRGEFKDGALKLETGGEEHAKIIFNAKLKQDGTLAGYISSPMGDMTWTAARADGKTKDGK